jgi:hypothetical protein
MAPSGTGAPRVAESPPRQADPPRRLEERPTPVRPLFDGSDHPDSNSLQRRQSRARSIDSASAPSALHEVDSSVAPRRLQSLLIRGGGAPDVHVSLVAGGGQGSTPAVAEVEGSAPEWGGVVMLSRQRIKAGQPLSWGAPSAQPPSRTRRGARRRSPVCAPRCKLSCSEPPSRTLRLVLLANLDSVFS